MDFTVQDDLSDAEIEAGLRNLIRENLFNQVMVSLTSGVFLVAFAAQLHASNFVIGLLAAISPLAQTIQLPAIALVERVRNRRKISVIATVFARSMWLLIALIPFLVPNRNGLILLLLGYAVHSSFVAISNCSFASWVRDLVPAERMGAFFSRRMSLSAALGMILGLLSALYMNQWKRFFPEHQLIAYSGLFLVGGIGGLIGILRFTARIPERRMRPSEGRFVHLLALPFRDTNFRSLIAFEGSWSFAINLAVPFFTVYMLRSLKFELTAIILLTTLSQLTNILFLRAWGRLSDQYGNKPILRACSTLFVLCILAWTFTTLPGRYALTIPLLIIIHAAQGIALAGVALAINNMGLRLAPPGHATPYLAARSLINSIAASLAPILGGVMADAFQNQSLLTLQHWDFPFLAAFVLGLFAIYRLAKVQESDNISRRAVIQALIKEVRQGARKPSN